MTSSRRSIGFSARESSLEPPQAPVADAPCGPAVAPPSERASLSPAEADAPVTDRLPLEPARAPRPQVETLADLGLAHVRMLTPETSVQPVAVAVRESADGECLAFAAIHAERFEIRAWSSKTSAPENPPHLAAWQRVAEALLALPARHELWHVLATRRPANQDGSAVRVGWLAVGRAASAADAIASASAGVDALREILAAHLDYVTLGPVDDPAVLLDLVRPLGAPFVRSLRRAPVVPVLGARSGETRRDPLPDVPAMLPPWPPSASPWGPVLEALAARRAHAAVVVRVRTHEAASPERRAAAERSVFALERALRAVEDSEVRDVGIVDRKLHAHLQALATRRMMELDRPGFAADLSIASWDPGCEGLLGVLGGALSPATEFPLFALARHDLAPGALAEPLDAEADPTLRLDASEAIALLRTVEPPCDERSPLACSRSRSLVLRASPAEGSVLGDGERRGGWLPALLDEEARLRHMYVVGQTGTGKSTLLLNLIAQDIAAGRGVTVLDPHGPLIEQVLRQIPGERADDVILVDPTDVERAVPMNPLAIAGAIAGAGAGDQSYLAMRDRVLDELIDTFDALYDLKATGGPIFEQYFRTFMAMLMGVSPPPDYVPRLPMLQMVMNDSDIQKRLVARLNGRDPITEATWRGMVDAGGDAALRNMVPYITSKLVRFYAPRV